MSDFGKHQTVRQASQTQAIELTRDAIKRQGAAAGFGNGAMPETKPRRVSLGLTNDGPINPRVRKI